MSSSFRNTNVYSTASGCRGSEKQDKRLYNRRLRRQVREALSARDMDLEAIVLPDLYGVSDTWCMSKDGKSYSTWLAGYRATLAKVIRVRAGRKRRFLSVTERTHAHHDKKLSEPRRFCGFWGNSPEELLETLRMRYPLSIALDLIRK